MSDNLNVAHIHLSMNHIQDKQDKEQLVTDVVVTMKNETKYLATFYTYDYLKNLITQEQSQKRLYWCMASFTLVESLESNKVKEIIDKMIDCGDFQLMFLKLD